MQSELKDTIYLEFPQNLVSMTFGNNYEMNSIIQSFKEVYQLHYVEEYVFYLKRESKMNKPQKTKNNV